MALTFTDDNFETEVLSFKGLVVVDFWATWCGPCRIQGPIVDSIAVKFSKNDKIKIGKLDVDENNTTAMKYQVMSIPTISIIKNGEVIETLVGLRSEKDLEDKINYYLNS
jgi:thioredoxin 1